jgi:hypothetical protein
MPDAVHVNDLEPEERKQAELSGDMGYVVRRRHGYDATPAALGERGNGSRVEQKSWPKVGLAWGIEGALGGRKPPEMAISAAQMVEPGGIEPPSTSPTLQDLRT